MKHIATVLLIRLKNDRRYQVRQFVEKPAQGTAPSNLAIMGRYVLTPEIFMFLDNQQKGAGGEIQLTDAIQRLNEIQRVFAYDFEGFVMMLERSLDLLRQRLKWRFSMKN